MNNLFEQFVSLSEIEQQQFLEQVNEHLDKWNKGHVAENAFGIKEFTEETNTMIEDLKHEVKKLEGIKDENYLLVEKIGQIKEIVGA